MAISNFIDFPHIRLIRTREHNHMQVYARCTINIQTGKRYYTDKPT